MHAKQVPPSRQRFTRMAIREMSPDPTRDQLVLHIRALARAEFRDEEIAAIIGFGVIDVRRALASEVR